MSQSNQPPSESGLPLGGHQANAGQTNNETTLQDHGSQSALGGDTGTKPCRNATWFLALLGVVLFFLVTVRGIVSMNCVFIWDAWEQFWPWFTYFADSIATSGFPLWDPHSSCGFPFHANPQAGVFYPVYGAAAWAAGGGYKVFQSLWLSHWLFAMVGLFLLLKKMDVSPLGAFAGSLTFGFSGFFIANAEHTVFINVASYAPWILLVLDAAHERHVAYALLAGTLLGIAGLSGYPGIFCYTVVMAALWVPLRYGLSWKTVTVVCIMGVVAGAVVSPAYLSFLTEGSGYTQRVAPLDLKTACDSGRFPLTAMISLMEPQLTVIYDKWFGSDVSMLDGYFGLLGVVALSVTVLHEPLRRRWKWLLIWMLIAWLFSLGSTGGLRVIAYYVIPVLKFTRHSSLFRVFWLMGGAILVGVLMDRLLSSSGEDRARMVRLAVWSSVVMSCLCLGVFLYTIAVPEPQAPALSPRHGAMIQVILATSCLIAFVLYYRTIVPRMVFGGIITLILLLDLFGHFSGNKMTVCFEGKSAGIAANLDMVSAARARESLTGTEKRHEVPLYHVNQGMFDREFYIRSYNPASSPDYDFLVGGSIGGDAGTPVKTPFLSVLERGPRFWLTPVVSYTDALDRRALATLRETGFPSAVPVFIHAQGPAAKDLPVRAIEPGTYGAVQVTQFRTESIVLQVKSPGDAWLFCTERYAPGWKAFVDNQPAKLYKANFCFRAVPVPKGTHEVRLQYDPRLYKPFWALSWFIILVVLGAFAIVRARGTRPSKQAQENPLENHFP